MGTYSDFEQRELDQQMGAEIDRQDARRQSEDGQFPTLEIACLEAEDQAHILGEATYVVKVGNGYDWQCTPTDTALRVYH